jgi:hypothetical protein
MYNILIQKLIITFAWKKSRLECFAQIIIRIIENSAVATKDLALGVKNNSKYAFFKDQKFNYNQIAKFILKIFACENYIIALDRTCWKFGKKDINILFLAIVVGKVSIAIYLHSLDHGGGCSQLIMEEILSRFINNFGANKIKYLLADREFMNRKWLSFLCANHIPFSIPLRKDMKIRFANSLLTRSVDKSFNYLKPSEYVERAGILWGVAVKFAAYRNSKNELMVVVANTDIDVNIFALYRFRLSIERLFKYLKTAGFIREKSHMTNPDRFAKLLACSAIAASLVIKHGLIQNEINPIKIRNCRGAKTQLFSLFTTGLDSLKHCLKKGARAFSWRLKKILEYDIFSIYNATLFLLLKKL